MFHKFVLLILSLLLLLSSCASDNSAQPNPEKLGTVSQELWLNWTPLNYATNYTNKIERVRTVATGYGTPSDPHLIVAVGVENGTNKLHYAILDGVNPENGRDEYYNLINPVWIPVGNASNYNIVSTPTIIGGSASHLIHIYGIHYNSATGQYIPVRAELNEVTRNYKRTFVSFGYWNQFSTGFVPKPMHLSIAWFWGVPGAAQALVAYQVSGSYDIYDYARTYYSTSYDNGATWHGPHRMAIEGALINKSSVWLEGFNSYYGTYGGSYALIRPHSNPVNLYSVKFLSGGNCNIAGLGGPQCWGTPQMVPNPPNTFDGSIFSFGFTGVTSTNNPNWSSWSAGVACLYIGRKETSTSKDSQYQTCGAPLYNNDMVWWGGSHLGVSSSDPNLVPRNVGLGHTNIVDAYMTRNCVFDTVKVMSNGYDTTFRKHFVRCAIP